MKGKILIFVLSLYTLSCGLWIFSTSKNQSKSQTLQRNGLRQHLKDGHRLLKERVRRVCANSKLARDYEVGNMPHDMLRQIIINKKHRLLFCAIPKGGSTNWKRIFYVLNSKASSTDPRNITSKQAHSNQLSYFTRLGQENPKERQKIVKTYFKFLIIRDPLERHISAYRDKIPRKKHNHSYDFLRKILESKIYTKSSNKQELIEKKKNGKNVITFADFLEFVRAPNGDMHWKLQTEICQPCAIDYDVIGSFEHMELESEYILQRARIGHLFKLPARKHHYSNAKSISLLNKFYGNVPDDLIISIYERFYKDYAIFGFPYHTFNKTKLVDYKVKLENEFCRDFSDKIEDERLIDYSSPTMKLVVTEEDRISLRCRT